MTRKSRDHQLPHFFLFNFNFDVESERLVSNAEDSFSKEISTEFVHLLAFDIISHSNYFPCLIQHKMAIVMESDNA